VSSVHFAKKIVQTIIRDEEFSRLLSNNSVGGFVPKYNRQSFIILIFVVLNSFINTRLKLKSSDFMSDSDKCIDSKPNNNTTRGGFRNLKGGGAVRARSSEPSAEGASAGGGFKGLPPENF